MKQQQLGDRTITSVGCGDVRLATAAARGVEAREVERALLTALELGITLIEASEEEAAERLCGEAVRAMRLRDRVVVASRVPELPVRPGAPRRDVLPERLPPAYVQQRIEASLRATRLDALPLVQLPLRGAWRASRAWPELAGTCMRLVREGKVLAWGALCGAGGGGREDGGDSEGGAGGRDGGEGSGSDAALVKEPWLAALSIPYSLCERGAEAVLTGGGSSNDSDDGSGGSGGSGGSAGDLGGLGPGGLGPGGLGLGGLSGFGSGGASGGSGIILIGDLVAGISAGSTGSSAGGTGAGAGGPGSGSGGAGPGGSGPGGIGDSSSGASGSASSSSAKAIFARRPLAGGALAGTLGPGVRLSLHDDRQSLDDAALERIAVLAARLAPLVEREPPAARSCVPARATLERGRRPPHVEALTLAELALRFVLDRGAVALPRLHRAEQIPEAIAAASAPPLSQALLDRLVELVRDD